MYIYVYTCICICKFDLLYLLTYSAYLPRGIDSLRGLRRT